MPAELATLYRTVWRWHFYAGLAVLPFLVILSITGAIYLFNDEINDVLHRDLRFADAATGPVLPLSTLAASATLADPASRITRIDTPRAPDRTVEVFVTPPSGAPVRVFVEPRTGRVLGSYIYSQTLVGFADQMHGSLLLGDFGDAIVELAACWGAILIITGLYLWWPRSRLPLSALLAPRFDLTGRRFWKSLHASVGFWTSALALFLILTGLPWATIWGAGFRSVISATGIGYPASYRTHGAPVSRAGLAKGGAEQSGGKPWTLEKMPDPVSHHDHDGAHAAGAEHQPVQPVLSLDAVADIVAQNGMHDPYRLSLPVGAAGVYAAVRYPDQPEGQRTLYLDQYTGEVLRDVKFSDYGVGAKAVELGVQIHMGNYFGLANQILMLIPCLGILVLAVTGPYMWWTRRPKGQLGAPPAPSSVVLGKLTGAIAVLGLLFPLAGLSMIAVFVLDKTAQAFRRPSAAR